MKTVMGLLKAGRGSVRFESRDLLAVPTHERARLGIGYMPEDRRLIPELTVEENVLVPAWAAGPPDARAPIAKNLRTYSGGERRSRRARACSSRAASRSSRRSPAR